MQNTTHIVFLILPQVHLLDIAGPDQAFLEAKEMGLSLNVSYCGIGKPVETSSGIAFGKLLHFSKISLEKGDYLFIPGASVEFLLGNDLKDSTEIFKWIKNLHAQGINICSICTGAFLLAQSGLLDGRKCTTHWKRTAQLKRLFPSIHVTDNILFTVDSGIYTSAGVSAGIDMALFIIAQLGNDHLAFQVARELVVYMRRTGSETQHSILMQYRNHIHSAIHKVQDYLTDHIEKKSNLDTLADIACMSSRSLTRIFKKETGISVNNYMTLIRKEKLQHLEKNPDISKQQLAVICGLKSERQVMRIMSNR